MKTLAKIGAMIAVASLFLTGCENVEAWEKAQLADYTMKPDRDALATAMTSHIHFSREATAGGQGVGGGGCGCN